MTSLPEQIRLFRLPPLSGPSKARNFGAAVAKGEYIAFLDDDDYWDQDFLGNAISALEREAADCVWGRIDILRNDEQRKYTCISYESLAVDVLLTRKKSGVGGINLLIRRDAFWLAGGYDESLRVSEDRSLAIELIKCGFKCAIAPDAIAVMRDHQYQRQRYFDFHRLQFIWKYRNDLGTKLLFQRGISIVTKALRRRLKRLIGRPS